VVAALDIGTSKIACLIGRLKPRSPDEVLRYRSHSVDIIGFGHTLARGIKAGTVVDIEQAEAAIRQCADLAERAAKVQLDAVIVAISSGRPASELICATIDMPGSSIASARSPGCSRRAASIPCVQVGPCCTRCRSGMWSITRRE